MLPERSMTRNSARLPCCGSIGGSAETGSMSSSTRALVAAWRERARRRQSPPVRGRGPGRTTAACAADRALRLVAGVLTRTTPSNSFRSLGSGWHARGGSPHHLQALAGQQRHQGVGLAGLVFEDQHVARRFGDDDSGERAASGSPTRRSARTGTKPGVAIVAGRVSCVSPGSRWTGPSATTR